MRKLSTIWVPRLLTKIATDFWDSNRVIFVECLVETKTINVKYYAELLKRLVQKIKKKRPQLAKNKILIHQNNALAHRSALAVARLYEL